MRSFRDNVLVMLSSFTIGLLLGLDLYSVHHLDVAFANRFFLSSLFFCGTGALTCIGLRICERLYYRNAPTYLVEDEGITFKTPPKPGTVIRTTYDYKG